MITEKLLLGIFILSTICLGVPEKFHVLKKIKLKGDTGWDCITADTTGGRLYLTRGTHVDVLNVSTGEAVGQIPGDGVHAVAIVHPFKHGFVTNGKSNSVTVFDLETLKVLGTVTTGKKPDTILYEPHSKRVLAFNGESKSVTVIDAEKMAAIGTLELGGKPEFAVADSSGNVFVNLEDKSSILSFDPVRLVKISEWPISPCEEPTGLSIDSQNHRLFAGCQNEKLVAVNSDNGKVVASLPIGKGVDGTAFDPALQLVFSSNGSGTLSVIHEESPDTYSNVENVPTQKSARTMALDLTSHLAYLVAAEFEELTEKEKLTHKRPQMKPSSAVLLVIGK